MLLIAILIVSHLAALGVGIGISLRVRAWVHQELEKERAVAQALSDAAAKVKSTIAGGK
jgi:hypothetical protein